MLDLWCLYKGNLDYLLCVSRQFSLTGLIFYVTAQDNNSLSFWLEVWWSFVFTMMQTNVIFLTQKSCRISFSVFPISPTGILYLLFFLFPSDNLCRNISVLSLCVSFLSSFFCLLSFFLVHLGRRQNQTVSCKWFQEQHG